MGKGNWLFSLIEDISMSVDSEPAHLEQEEEEEEVEVEEVDAPAHHPYAPPDEVTITFHQCLSFFFFFFICLVL